MERTVCLKIEDWEKEDLHRACQITSNEYHDTNYIEANYLMTLIEDLTVEYDKLLEDYKDLENKYADKYYGK